jgi:hypothetical protein
MIARLLCIAAFASVWSVAAAASPPTETATEGASYTDQTAVIERFRYLERIDITTDKPAVAPDLQEPLPASVEAILEEAEALEDGAR